MDTLSRRFSFCTIQNYYRGFDWVQLSIALHYIAVVIISTESGPGHLLIPQRLILKLRISNIQIMAKVETTTARYSNQGNLSLSLYLFQAPRMASLALCLWEMPLWQKRLPNKLAGLSSSEYYGNLSCYGFQQLLRSKRICMHFSKARRILSISLLCVHVNMCSFNLIFDMGLGEFNISDIGCFLSPATSAHVLSSTAHAVFASEETRTES